MKYKDAGGFMQNHLISIRIDHQTYSLLEKHAAELDRPKAWLIKKGVRAYLEALDRKDSDSKNAWSRFWEMTEGVTEMGSKGSRLTKQLLDDRRSREK